MELGFESIFQKESLSSTAINPKSRDANKLKNYYKLLETTNYNNETDQYDFELDNGRNDLQSHRPMTDKINDQPDFANNNEIQAKKTKSSIDIIHKSEINSRLLSQYLEIKEQYGTIQDQYIKLQEHCDNMENKFSQVLELLKKKKRSEEPIEVVINL